MKKFVIAAAIVVAVASAASAQSGGRGRGSYAGAGSNPDVRFMPQQRWVCPRTGGGCYVVRGRR